MEVTFSPEPSFNVCSLSASRLLKLSTSPLGQRTCTDSALVAVPSDRPSYYEGNVGAGVAAYQIGGSGALTRTATLAHGTLPATRSVVIDSQVWAVTAAGVITANLTDLPTTAWHPY